MATLLKFYKPLFPSLISPLPVRFHNCKTLIAAARNRPRIRCLSTMGNSKGKVNIKESNGDAVDGDGTETQLQKQQLWLHNTMSKQRELFIPKVPGKVGMYVCGVTAYDLSHIGHARVYVSFDVLYRYLNYLGYEVNYVRNFTDVDDKIIARANELREDPIKLSKRFCEEFHLDMAYLHCLPPSVEPRVSDHMANIIDMIQQILDNGCAYTINGDVYFSVDKFPEYGKLSGRRLEDNRAGERVAVDTRKKNPADFALWKVIDLYHPLALRLFLIGTHYRSPINYTVAQIESASDRLFYIYQALYDSQIVLSQRDEASRKDSIPAGTASCINKFQDEFLVSMSDDLHTPVALAAMSDPLKLINDLLHTRKGKKQGLRIESLAALEKTIRSGLEILGLVPTSYEEALHELREKSLKRAKLTEDQVRQKITERDTARQNKEYERSDAIRKELAAVGIALMDSPEGTTWRPAIPLALQEEQVVAP
ncbi:cysteine--tRNA ligase, chloroplastic/mitochondrial isoform X2 [Nicotiana tomentosiformis]|uniref:cysteine--tRNA ligase, chloroplastic/mitochondrial isoform X2 n=1 Tax=Nicotiana tomentosiformis TaxID=4098 RepID=UPI000878AAB5|nr:cysteine--tRNA ligase, chloroplastic/mitochondrial isoform X2 [Nicotiana tomentosiformis]